MSRGSTRDRTAWTRALPAPHVAPHDDHRPVAAEDRQLVLVLLEHTDDVVPPHRLHLTLEADVQAVLARGPARPAGLPS